MGDASDKVSIFKDVVSYLSNVDKALDTFRSEHKDDFENLFGTPDSDIIKLLETVFGTTQQAAQGFVTLKDKIAEASSSNANLKVLRGIAEEINALYVSIGKAPPIDIEAKFVGKGSKGDGTDFVGRIKLLEDTVNEFGSTFKGFQDRLKGGFGAGGAGGGKDNPITSAVQDLIDKLNKQNEDLVEAKKQLDATLGDFKNTDTISDKYKIDVTEESVRDLISEYDSLETSLQSADKSSAEYYNTLTKLVEISLKLKSAFREVQSNDELDQIFTNARGGSGNSTLRGELSKYANIKSPISKTVQKTLQSNIVENAINNNNALIEELKVNNDINTVVEKRADLYDTLKSKVHDFQKEYTAEYDTDKESDESFKTQTEIVANIQELVGTKKNITSFLQKLTDDGQTAEAVVQKLYQALGLDLPDAFKSKIESMTSQVEVAEDATKKISDTFKTDIPSAISGSTTGDGPLGKMVNELEYVSALAGQLKNMFATMSRRTDFEYNISVSGLDIEALKGDAKQITHAAQTESYLDSLFKSSTVYGHSHRGGSGAYNTSDVLTYLDAHRDALQSLSFVVGGDDIQTLDLSKVDIKYVDKIKQKIKELGKTSNAPILADEMNKIVEEMTGVKDVLRSWDVSQIDELAQYMYNVAQNTSAALSPLEKFQAILNNYFGAGKVSASKYTDLLSGLNADNAKQIFNQIAKLEKLPQVGENNPLTMGQVNTNIDENINKFKALREEAKLTYEDIKNEVSSFMAHLESDGSVNAGLDFFKKYFPDGEWQEVRGWLTDAYDGLMSIEEVQNRIATEFLVDPDTFAAIPTGSGNATGSSVEQAKAQLKDFLDLTDEIQNKSFDLSGAEGNVEVGRYTERLETARDALLEVALAGQLTSEELNQANSAFEEASGRLKDYTTHYDGYGNGNGDYEYTYEDEYHDVSRENERLRRDLDFSEKQYQDVKEENERLREELADVYQNTEPLVHEDIVNHNANADAIKNEADQLERLIKLKNDIGLASLYAKFYDDNADEDPNDFIGQKALEEKEKLLNFLGDNPTQTEDDLKVLAKQLQEKMAPVQESVKRISKLSEVPKNLPTTTEMYQEAAKVGQQISKMYDDGITDTEEYIALQHKLLKIFDKIKACYGGVKYSGARDDFELNQWIYDNMKQDTGFDYYKSSLVDALYNAKTSIYDPNTGKKRLMRDMAAGLLEYESDYFYGADAYNRDLDKLKDVQKVLDVVAKRRQQLFETPVADDNVEEDITAKDESKNIEQTNKSLKEKINIIKEISKAYENMYSAKEAYDEADTPAQEDKAEQKLEAATEAVEELKKQYYSLIVTMQDGSKVDLKVEDDFEEAAESIIANAKRIQDVEIIPGNFGEAMQAYERIDFIKNNVAEGIERSWGRVSAYGTTTNALEYLNRVKTDLEHQVNSINQSDPTGKFDFTNACQSAQDLLATINSILPKFDMMAQAEEKINELGIKPDEADIYDVVDGVKKGIFTTVDQCVDKIKELTNFTDGNITPDVGTNTESEYKTETVAIEQRNDALEEGNALKKEEANIDAGATNVNQGNVAEESIQLNTLKGTLVEVKEAVQAKTKAFYDEGQVVGQAVGKEISALKHLKELLEEIEKIVSRLSGAEIAVKTDNLEAAIDSATKISDNNTPIVNDSEGQTNATQLSDMGTLNQTIGRTNGLLEGISRALSGETAFTQLISSLNDAVAELKNVASGIVEHQKRQMTDKNMSSARIANNYGQLSSIASDAITNMGDGRDDSIKIKGMKSLADNVVRVEGAVRDASGSWNGFIVDINEANKATITATNTQSAFAKELNETAEAAKKAAAETKQSIQDVSNKTKSAIEIAREYYSTTNLSAKQQDFYSDKLVNKALNNAFGLNNNEANKFYFTDFDDSSDVLNAEYYKTIDSILQKIGYHLGELKPNMIDENTQWGFSAEVVANSNHVVTNLEEARQILFGIKQIEDTNNAENTSKIAEQYKKAAQERELQKIIGQVNLEKGSLGFNFNARNLSNEQNEIVDAYDAIIAEIDKYEIAVKNGQQVELDSINRTKDALFQKIDAYKQANNIVDAGTKGNKKAPGATVVKNATTKYNALKNAANIDEIKDASIVKESLAQYTAAYEKLINLQKEYKVGQVLDSAQEQEFNDARVACSNYAKELEKLLNTYQKSKDNATIHYDELGSDFVDDEAGRKKALQDFLEITYGADATFKKFDDGFNKIIYTVNNGDGTFTEMTATINNTRTAIDAVAGEAKEATGVFASFWKELKGKFGSLLSYTMASLSIHDAIRVVKQGVTYVKEIDSALTELKKVTDETESAYQKFLNTASKTAGEVGSTIADFTNATADFARLGYNIEQASELARAASVYKNVGDGIDDISTASESIISTMKAYGIEAENAMGIVDRFNEVGNNFAISSTGIGDAMQRSASALFEAGNTIDESIALITGANSVIQNPEQVGTALKTLALRLRGAKVELEEAGEDVDGMAESTSQLQAKLKALTHGKVDIMVDADTFKNTTQILREMSLAWEEMTDIERAERCPYVQKCA